MKLTNLQGLPEPLVDALERDDYGGSKADFSVTQLIAPPRIVQLRKRHAEHLTTDVSDRIFALFGQAVHSILEKAAGNRYLVEHRFFTEHDGATISGQIDLYDRQMDVLQDWKLTSYHAVADGPKPEWIAQCNLNRLLMRRNDIKEVKKMEIVAIFRDFSKLMAFRKPNEYPQSQVAVIPILIWPEAKTVDYLSERIALHRAAENELPLCSSVERWERPRKWAVMKKGQKRAVKLYDEREQADSAVKDGQFVEERPGENVRCLHYCDVAPYCDFARELIREKI